MRVTVGFAVLFAGALLLASRPAAADAGPYIGLETGVAILSDSDISGFGTTGRAEFDAGFNIGAAVGYGITDAVRAELAVSYRQGDVDQVTAPGITSAGAGDVGVFAVLVNGYYDIDLGGPVTPYIGLGIGVGLIDSDSNSSANVLRVDDDSTEFAWNVMGGVSFRLTDQILLDGGYRYLSTTDAKLDAVLVGVGSGSVEAEVGVHELLVGVRYEF